ncbi:MAG: threonylcarbamoyl-AMP synthase [Candidatus Altiarchaeales archaeon]|nr:MAG: threonylcarbamoyl-AMP synthase [Candidatus Altiarchaeales archaeon]
MKILKIDPASQQRDIILKISKEILEGKIFVYPTDTVYGIGCGISFEEKIKEIYEIKKRSFDKPVSIAFSDLGVLKSYTILSKEEEEFIKKNYDKGYTFVVRKKRGKIPEIVSKGSKVGVRIIPLKLIQGIIRESMPIITTSANLSGKKAPAKISEIEKEILKRVDFILDGGKCKLGKPSRVIDLETMEILRDF